MRAQHGPGLRATGNASVSLPGLAARGPGSFLMHYAGRRPGGHMLVFASVLAAVCCAIGAQYGVKNLVDVLGAGATTDRELWSAMALLLALVAGDNLFWRLAGRVAAPSFVGVAGDVRDDLFSIYRVTARAISQTAFPVRWPAASRLLVMPRSRSRTGLPGIRSHRRPLCSAALRCSDWSTGA